MPINDPNTISLSLVSHTNVGKTTLARTLLSQNVGEVRDEAHVTDMADRFELARTPEGDQLLLWDTPGFGDSARLARRLLQSEKPIGWFVSQVWDRFADRPLWSSQQAVRNVREDADIVLYLVNAAENPEDASYVEPEMKILAWIGKPIIVLLNQMGPPAGHKAESAEIERWRSYLNRFGVVRQVLALDAFARCWVQEGALLQAVAPALPASKQPAFERLNLLWQNQRRKTFDRSMHTLASHVAATALDRERIPNSSLKDQLREVGKVLGVTRDKADDAKQLAMKQLAERLNTSIRESTDEIIQLHGLEGHASEEVLNRLAEHYDITENLNESHAAMVGGLVTGALAGLKADVLAGGLTLGGGMIAGGVLGALGGAGLARGYNMVRGIDAVTVTWTDAVMNRLVHSSLLTYLAIAHYGRGRGEWAQSEHPAHWESTVQEVLAQQQEAFNQFWRKRQNYGPEALTKALQTELTLAMERILIRLYPNALSMAALGSGAKRLNINLAADLAEASGANTRKKPQPNPEPEHAADIRAGFAAAGIHTTAGASAVAGTSGAAAGGMAAAAPTSSSHATGGASSASANSAASGTSSAGAGSAGSASAGVAAASSAAVGSNSGATAGSAGNGTQHGASASAGTTVQASATPAASQATSPGASATAGAASGSSSASGSASLPESGAASSKVRAGDGGGASAAPTSSEGGKTAG